MLLTLHFHFRELDYDNWKSKRRVRNWYSDHFLAFPLYGSIFPANELSTMAKFLLFALEISCIEVGVSLQDFFFIGLLQQSWHIGSLLGL